MPVLSLFAHHLRKFFREVILLLRETLHFLFVFNLHRGQLVAEIFVLISQCLILALDPRGLVLALLPVHLELVPLLARFLPELQIGHALPHHVIHARDRLLDVVGLPPE